MIEGLGTSISKCLQWLFGFSKQLLPADTGQEEAGILEKGFLKEVTLCWGSESDYVLEIPF